jgi:type II secretion system protein C
MGSPNELAKEIAFAPFQKNNEPYGIKFLRMKPEGFFGGIGLRQNDILLSINAQRLKTPEDFFRIYQLFNNENNLSFKVDRDGQIMDFVVDIR